MVTNRALLNKYLTYKRLSGVYVRRKDEYMSNLYAEKALDFAGVLLDLGIIAASALFAQGHDAFCEGYESESQKQESVAI